MTNVTFTITNNGGGLSAKADVSDLANGDELTFSNQTGSNIDVSLHGKPAGTLTETHTGPQATPLAPGTSVTVHYQKPRFDAGVNGQGVDWP